MSSLRHPHVSLRDTIAMKLVALNDPYVVHSWQDPRMEHAQEIVDDIVDLVFEELEGQRYESHQDRWGWLDRPVRSRVLRAQGWLQRVSARLCGG